MTIDEVLEICNKYGTWSKGICDYSLNRGQEIREEATGCCPVCFAARVKTGKDYGTVAYERAAFAIELPDEDAVVLAHAADGNFLNVPEFQEIRKKLEEMCLDPE